MQMVVQYYLTVHQLDVTTAYVHAPFNCEIFIEETERFKTKTNMTD